MNIYKKKVIPMIPESYYKKDPKSDTNEELLYLVSFNNFYLDELFENAEDEIGIHTLSKCE